MNEWMDEVAYFSVRMNRKLV